MWYASGARPVFQQDEREAELIVCVILLRYQEQ
jgi:hypothetical protein